MSNKKKLYAAILLLASQNIYAAANFSITPSGVLPTTVAPGQSVSAYFTLTNMTNSTRSGYVIQGLPGTVVQNTSAPNCPNPIDLLPYASCQLRLDVSGAASAMIAICKGTSCTTATAPLNVSVSNDVPVVPKIPKFAYVAQYSANNGVQVCTVDPTTGLLSNCGDPGGHNVLDNAFPQSIVINNSGTIAYLTGYTDTPFAYQCTINRNDGTFTQCSSTNITTPAGYNPEYGKMALNNANTISFIADASSGVARILACPIVSGAISPTCSDAGATGIGDDSVGIVFNSTETVAYIGDYPIGTVTVCDFNGSTFSGCTNKTGDGVITFGDPAGVSLNNAGDILYIADNSSKNVYGCDTTPTGTALFSHCFIAGTVTGPSTVWGVNINATNTYAYLTDFTATTYICPILSGGTFGPCAANNSFTDPVHVALLY